MSSKALMDSMVYASGCSLKMGQLAAYVGHFWMEINTMSSNETQLSPESRHNTVDNSLEHLPKPHPAWLLRVC